MQLKGPLTPRQHVLVQLCVAADDGAGRGVARGAQPPRAVELGEDVLGGGG
jgi:hypothetical protein